MAASSRPASWLIAAALTAAVWPAISVVAGHLGSAALGYAELPVAILRSAVGFTAVVGGALVMAPALTLALLWLAGKARGADSPGMAAPVAMGLLWPAWAAGVVVAVPPLFGQGPGIGELVWAALAAIVALRTIRVGAAPGLNIPRRWKARFVFQSTIAFVGLFLSVAIGPAVLARSMLNVAAPATQDAAPGPALPQPPEADW